MKDLHMLVDNENDLYWVHPHTEAGFIFVQEIARAAALHRTEDSFFDWVEGSTYIMPLNKRETFDTMAEFEGLTVGEGVTCA